MDLYKKIPFEHDEKSYEIRIHYQENLINIGAFLNNYPANGFRYQIQIPKQVEIKKILDEKHLKIFIDRTKKDIEENLWNDFSSLFIA
jgi:hypothetical protein